MRELATPSLVFLETTTGNKPVPAFMDISTDPGKGITRIWASSQLHVRANTSDGAIATIWKSVCPPKPLSALETRLSKGDR